MKLSRREFLGMAAVLGLPPVPTVLLRAAEGLSEKSSDRKLVVLQLSGGNDGLNTVIPFEESAYRDNRPTLAVGKGEALTLSDGPFHTTGAPLAGPGPKHVGFHPRMKALWDLYREGAVAVVQGVGYPNPSRSHFRSMDIWHTASPEREDVELGWLGGAVARSRPALQGLFIGDERLPLALHGEVQVPTLQNLDWVDYLAARPGQELRRRLRDLHTRPRTGDAERVRSLAMATLGGLEKIVELRNRPVSVDYPASRLAEKLKWVGQLVAGDFPSRIYYLTLNGFDTHAQQKDGHAHLLGELSDGLAAFHRHLKSLGMSEKVTVLVFSEFGRRVRENGSLGTDHGCAAPVIVVSGGVRGGLHGAHPSMDDLDEGDLRHHTDFRRIYATMLEDVLGVRHEQILGGKFERLELFGKLRRV